MRFLTLRIVALVMAFALPAHAFDTNARAAWVYDVATGTVLMEKNANEPLPPASISHEVTRLVSCDLRPSTLSVRSTQGLSVTLRITAT